MFTAEICNHKTVYHRLLPYCRLAERGKIKCDAYWPLEPLETADYGKFKITNMGIANKGDYQITLLEAQNREVLVLAGPRQFEIPELQS